MTAGRVIRLVGAVAALLLATVILVVGGWPDPARALGVVTGGSISGQTEAAFVVLLCWVLVIMAALLIATDMRRRASLGGRRFRLLALCLSALLLVTLGVARQQAGYRVCCASRDTVQQVQRLVR